ncbi:MAG: GtrA family protein [Chlorobium sp.]
MRQVIVQLFRYAIVGLLSNSIGFLLYLFFTNQGFGSKMTMSFLYCGGVIFSFIFNKKWTFSVHKQLSQMFLRYILIYGVGYLLNFCALFIFVDRYGYQHQWVQGVMIPLVAVMLFVMQKIWVFRFQ